MRYSGGIIKWSQEELYKLDVNTRKPMSMHGSFSVNSDMDRLYIPRKHGGRGLISVSFVIEHEKRNLSFYVHNSTDELLMLVAKNFEKFQEHGRCYKQYGYDRTFSLTVRQILSISPHISTCLQYQPKKKIFFKCITKSMFSRIMCYF